MILIEVLHHWCKRCQYLLLILHTTRVQILLQSICINASLLQSLKILLILLKEIAKLCHFVRQGIVYQVLRFCFRYHFWVFEAFFLAPTSKVNIFLFLCFKVPILQENYTSFAIKDQNTVT